jgi:hypothetical protein
MRAAAALGGLLAAIGCAAESPTAAAGSGIEGRVVAWPSCAVEQAGRACPLRALAAHVSVARPTGERVALVATSDGGRFRIGLMPGDYAIEAVVEGAACVAVAVTVRLCSYPNVELRCDIGIR